MKEAHVDIGKTYALRSVAGGEVQDVNGNSLATLEANTQQHVTAQEAVWLVPDDCKVTKVTFNGAPIAFGGGGGGIKIDGDYVTLDSNGAITSGRLDNLINGYYMQSSKYTLISWNIDLPALSSGSNMFNGCRALTSFNSELPALTSGSNMFYSCSALTSFNSELPALTSGNYMFYSCSALTSFNIDLPAMTSGSNMFNSCSALTSFNSELPALTSAGNMFYKCSALTSFNSELPALTSGSNMFNSCQLDKPSALRVLNSIPTYTSGTHPLTIGIHVDHRADEEVAAALTAAADKGWTVTTQWNGTATA